MRRGQECSSCRPGIISESDEKPAHKVCVDEFWLGKYEVTQAQWQKIMGNNPAYHQDSPSHPVEEVSWDDVQEYLRKLN
jgi:formylglycine-generating enzyme required for sulfatase activity